MTDKQTVFDPCSPLARQVICAKDDALLCHLYDDNQRIEPEWYCPIIPMVLVNGADGIGTGWSTKIPNYDIREVVANLKRMINGLDPLPMVLRFSFISSGLYNVWFVVVRTDAAMFRFDILLSVISAMRFAPDIHPINL